MQPAHVAYPDLSAHWHGLTLLARGANRICVIDPDDAAHCLKFELSDSERTHVGARAQLRRRLARLIPALGENATELRAWQRLHARVDAAHEVFAPCDALTKTSWGTALRCALIRTDDGAPARSLFAHLFDHTGCNADALCAEVDRIERWLIDHRVPLFDLNAGNFVVAGSAAQPRLICIDAKSLLAGKEIVPLSRWSAALMQRKIQRRAARLRERIRQALADPQAAH